MYDREGEGTFLFVISDYDVYILDENLPGGMVHLKTCGRDDICGKTSLAAIMLTLSAG